MIFGDKSLSDLFEDIYKTSRTKSETIKGAIDEVRAIIKKSQSVSDVATLGPLIADLLEVGVKNDEHLLKLATIVQRLVSAEIRSSGEDTFLTEEEKEQLLESAKEELDKISEDAEKAKKELAEDLGISDTNLLLNKKPDIEEVN